ncbi:MAG TPA: asparagine synthase (glutamine-hydrolyzing), partial [Acidobacteriota bacterium]|nr:asparagine synthase (glutamine-hydrolyzing) [Acidobacteriota bacterium]
MCGIAGVYSFAPGVQISRETLHRMSGALEHRGPDEEGFYVGPNAAFAHRRLKIIDLSRDAAQPMSDESARYHLVFNGEIYNFRDLRAPLESRYTFFSRSDTEVILRLFQNCREHAWERLRGMFALALYDAQARELFLARDAAGIKPLYCYQDQEKLVFASEIKGLAATGMVPLETDHTSLLRYLKLGYFPGRSTPYRGVFKILPGEYARVTANGVAFQRFWNLREFAVRPNSQNGLVEKLDSLLQRSVEGHMISDVPLGAFLSGGVDSSLLVALMARAHAAPVKTFTVGFSHMGYYDERAHAARVA